ncbi:MAG TPA: HisA/HisF-related TIM barrel protein [Novosphingobium sp.]|nr:HisA/HisF-related TIM barrel protein [Novosphingobium sp.]
MIKKRLAAVVTVRNGLAVQSFGYRRYLPLGKPEVLIENFDRWGADEIILQCIDRGNQGPDYALLDRVSRLGLSTPLIYAGGIDSVGHAVRTIQAGADRICVDAMLHDAPNEVRAIAEPLGAQAIIAALPLSWQAGELLWRDYRDCRDRPLAGQVLDVLQSGAISEALVIDWQHEGSPGAFDMELVTRFPVEKMPVIACGGISEAGQRRSLLERPGVAAAAIGNFLSYREHAVQALKKQLAGLPLRPWFHQRQAGI